jgi:hypothetical protein
MPQEAVTETFALVCPLDQSGNVGKDEPMLALGDADVRRECRERVGGDLRRGRRQRGEQRRLARRRQTDETDVGDRP